MLKRLIRFLKGEHRVHAGVKGGRCCKSCGWHSELCRTQLLGGIRLWPANCGHCDVELTSCVINFYYTENAGFNFKFEITIDTNSWSVVEIDHLTPITLPCYTGHPTWLSLKEEMKDAS